MKMRNTLCLTLLLLGSGLSLPTQAAAASELETTMKSLGRQYRQVLETEDPARLQQGLEAMHQAATRARGQLPERLQGLPADDPERQTYRQGMDELRTGIARAQALLQAGRTDEAMVAAQELKSIRRQYHRHFDVK